jgi:hypothetical protein
MNENKPQCCTRIAYLAFSWARKAWTYDVIFFKLGHTTWNLDQRKFCGDIN